MRNNIFEKVLAHALEEMGEITNREFEQLAPEKMGRFISLSGSPGQNGEREIHNISNSSTSIDTTMSDMVTLNVGGVVYTTTKTTLTKYSDSMLASMFSGRMNASSRDTDGHLFIDRDGSMFAFVLEFLRCGKLSLPYDFTEKDRLLTEAKFYQLEQMMAAVKSEEEVDARRNMLNYISITTTEDKINGDVFMYVVGSNVAISKLPPEYIDSDTRIQLHKRRGEIFTSKISLQFLNSSYFKDVDAVNDAVDQDVFSTECFIENFEKDLQSCGWVETSNFSSLPFTDNEPLLHTRAIVHISAWYYAETKTLN